MVGLGSGGCSLVEDGNNGESTVATISHSTGGDLLAMTTAVLDSSPYFERWSRTYLIRLAKRHNEGGGMLAGDGAGGLQCSLCDGGLVEEDVQGETLARKLGESSSMNIAGAPTQRCEGEERVGEEKMKRNGREKGFRSISFDSGCDCASCPTSRPALPQHRQNTLTATGYLL